MVQFLIERTTFVSLTSISKDFGKTASAKLLLVGNASNYSSKVGKNLFSFTIGEMFS
jgi:hypothetical protein